MSEYQDHDRLDFKGSKILAIDVGTRESGWCLWSVDESRILRKGIHDNERIVAFLRESDMSEGYYMGIEMLEMYSSSVKAYDKNGKQIRIHKPMPIGKESLRSVIWIGRFIEASNMPDRNKVLVYRRRIARYWCGKTGKRGDAEVRRALVQQFGEPSTKLNPNMVYGGDYKDKMRSHIWSALALAGYLAYAPYPLWHYMDDEFPKKERGKKKRNNWSGSSVVRKRKKKHPF